MGIFQVLNCANDTKSCNALRMSCIQKTQRLPEEKQDKLQIKLVMDTIFSHRRRLLNTELVKVQTATHSLLWGRYKIQLLSSFIRCLGFYSNLLGLSQFHLNFCRLYRIGTLRFNVDIRILACFIILLLYSFFISKVLWNLGPLN